MVRTKSGLFCAVSSSRMDCKGDKEVGYGKGNVYTKRRASCSGGQTEKVMKTIVAVAVGPKYDQTISSEKDDLSQVRPYIGGLIGTLDTPPPPVGYGYQIGRGYVIE